MRLSSARSAGGVWSYPVLGDGGGEVDWSDQLVPVPPVLEALRTAVSAAPRAAALLAHPHDDIVLHPGRVARLRPLHPLELPGVELPVVVGDGVEEGDVAHDVGAGPPVPHVVQDADLVVDEPGQDPQEGPLYSAHDLVPLPPNLYPGLAVEHGHLPTNRGHHVHLRGNQR